MFSIADQPKTITIYAVGGGRGHLVRACTIAERLLKACGGTRPEISIVAHPAALAREAIRMPVTAYPSLGEPEAVSTLRGDLLIVDSFPRGFREELDSSFMRRFRRRVFVARYNRELTVEALAKLSEGLYHQTVLPYPAGLSEWPAEIANAIYVGHLVRSNAVNVVTVPRRFTIVDPDGRCSETLRGAFERIADAASFELNYVRTYSRTLSGSHFLAVGAGYNLFYELLHAMNVLPQRTRSVSTGTPPEVRFIPIMKRWDDQHRRVRLFEMTARSLSGIADWLMTSDRVGESVAAATRAGHDLMSDHVSISGFASRIERGGDLGTGHSDIDPSPMLTRGSFDSDPQALIRGVLG